MNKDHAKEVLPLVQALADGKTIQQYMHVDIGKQEWRDCVNPEFDRYAPSSFRIKPEPREIWVNRTPCGVVACLTWESEEEARKHAIEGTTPIRFREVLE